MHKSSNKPVCEILRKQSNSTYYVRTKAIIIKVQGCKDLVSVWAKTEIYLPALWLSQCNQESYKLDAARLHYRSMKPPYQNLQARDLSLAWLIHGRDDEVDSLSWSVSLTSLQTTNVQPCVSELIIVTWLRWNDNQAKNMDIPPIKVGTLRRDFSSVI